MRESQEEKDEGSYNETERVEWSTVLVEEVVADFDLGAGFEVVWKQHDRYGHMAQVINLRMTVDEQLMDIFAHRYPSIILCASGPRTYRVIDSPHQDAQHGVTASENLHFLLHKVLLFAFPFGRQSVQKVGGVPRRRHRTSQTVPHCVSRVPLVIRCFLSM